MRCADVGIQAESGGLPSPAFGDWLCRGSPSSAEKSGDRPVGIAPQLGGEHEFSRKSRAPRRDPRAVEIPYRRRTSAGDWIVSDQVEQRRPRDWPGEGRWCDDDRTHFSFKITKSSKHRTIGGADL